MQVYQPITALLLRIALGVMLIVPVADRLGWVGSPGDKNSSWGSRGPINFSVWVDSIAALLLATLPTYAYSVDAWRLRKRPSILF